MKKTIVLSWYTILLLTVACSVATAGAIGEPGRAEAGKNVLKNVYFGE